MALRLRVISEHRRPLGERATMIFGTAGGTIGRSSDNDWVLPDPERYVSAHHARIRFREGRYELEDTSRNGIFVNDDERPAVERGPYRLEHGDVLRLGEYEVVVALEPEDAKAHVAASPGTSGSAPAEPAAADLSSSASVLAIDSMPTQIEQLQSVGRAAQTDLGAALRVDDLFLWNGDSTSEPAPVRASTSPPSSPPSPPPSSPLPPPRPSAFPASAPETDLSHESIARRIERLARAAAKARDARGTPLPGPQESRFGLEAFCQGAGFDAQQLPADADSHTLHLVGRLLREALVGLKDLERERNEIRNRLHIDLPVDPEDPAPTLGHGTIEELLIEVLAKHESRELDAVRWLRDAIAAAKAHEKATAEAFRGAFVEFIDRFDPAELEARFERASRRGKAGGSRESRNWTLFTELYHSLTEMPADKLPHTFLEAFANAYRQALGPAPRP
ncbi:MAG: type VI secretion system-associated FHA domain protein TagH [Steroidobacteraceae bacterium]